MKKIITLLLILLDLCYIFRFGLGEIRATIYFHKEWAPVSVSSPQDKSQKKFPVIQNILPKLFRRSPCTHAREEMDIFFRFLGFLLVAAFIYIFSELIPVKRFFSFLLLRAPPTTL